jgi:hypothetical protein
VQNIDVGWPSTDSDKEKLMSGINIVLVGDFLVGFAIAWMLRGLCDRWEYKLSHLFTKKDKSDE